MRFSFLRFVQWIGIAIVLVALVGLNFNFESRAGKTVNAPVENSLSQSMRGSWFLDDGSGTNATDASGNGNTLAMTGSPSWVAGQIGPYSLDFSGSGQYLSVADPASGVLDFGDGADFSISGWFNRDTAAADHTIVAKKNDQTTNAGYVVWIDNNGSTDYLSAEISDGTDTYSAIGTTDLSSTGWHQFSIVWDDSNGLYIYLDGKLDGSTTSSTASINSLANALAFRIGAESDAGVPFDGKIDDITLYGHALSANEVFTLYQTAVPIQPVDTGLVGHWTFDGNDVDWSNTTTEIKDVSGQGNNGDAVSLTTASAVRGKLGQALSFNGTSDGVVVGDVLDLDDTADVTLSGWFKYQNIYSGDRTILAKRNGQAAGDTGYILYLDDSTNKLVFEVSDGTDEYQLTSTSAFTSGAWNHFVVVWDQDSAANSEIFINGAADSATDTGTIGNIGTLNNTLSLKVGVEPKTSGTVYRSVGTNSAALASGSPATLTISGTDATFSAALANTIGVGDVVQYQVSSTYYVAFIHARIDSTHYTVASSTGGTPTASGGAITAWNIYRSYTSLTNWNAQDENDTLNNTVENFDTSKNLVTNTRSMYVACYADGTDGAVQVDGWTTNASYFIRIYTPVWPNEVGISQRHAGVWDSTKFTASAAVSGYTSVLDIRDDYVRVEGLQVELTGTSAFQDYDVIVQNTASSSDVQISQNILRNTAGGTAQATGVFVGSGKARLWNNIAYGFSTDGNSSGFECGSYNGAICYVYNNTSYGNYFNFFRSSGDETVYAKNNLADSHTGGGDYSGNFDASSTNNLSSDATAPGSNSRTSQNPLYGDESGKDFHLQSTDTAAKNYGATLSTDSNLAIIDDVDSNARSGSWDIGADEYVSGTQTFLLDDIRVYNRVLSSTEIASLYNSGK